MSPKPRPWIARVERLAERALSPARDPAFPWVAAALFAAASLAAVRSDRYLHDEGILTYIFARWVVDGGMPAVFFLKVKPLLALINLPGALAGLDAFFVWHALVCSLSVALAASVARRARLGEPWLAASVVATSHLLLASSASGISNADGVLVALVAVRLAASGRPGPWLGAALCAIPLVRFELGILSAVLGLWALGQRPSRGFWLGLIGPALAFVAAGAVYHHDPLWPWHFAPAYGDIHGKNIVVLRGIDQLTMNQVLDALAAVTPAFALGLLVRPPPGSSLAVPLSRFGLAFSLFSLTMPFARSLFGFAPRYYLIALVAFAFGAPLALEYLSLHAPPAERRAVLATLVLALAIALVAGAPAAASACALSLAVAALVSFGAPHAAKLALAASLGAWAAFCPPATELERAGTPNDPAPVVAWLRERPDLWQGRVVYTNLQLLDAYAHRSGRLPQLRLRVIIQADVWQELSEWSNHRNGQSARIAALVREDFYGRGATIEEVLDGHAPAGTLLLINPDPRLVPPALEAAWRERTEPFATVHGVEVRRVRDR